MIEPSIEVQLTDKPIEERLDSWKEIAAYLNRDVTTVQRWEKREGMPVHRHLHDKRGSVYALPKELDAWLKGRRAQLLDEGDAVVETPKPEEGSQPQRAGQKTVWVVLAGVAAVALLGSYFVVRERTRNATPPKIRSVAVLPLRNLSGDASQDYLADGMTEALIDRLSSIRNLQVISHTSVMRFKNPQVSEPEIAKILGVDAIVEGSVIRDGSRVRVTAQLIRGSTDKHFWSQTYDREMRDALTLESELAQAIAEKVEVTITGPEHQRLAAVRPVAPEVYESYLKGRFALEQANSSAGFEASKNDFEATIKQDPTFAPAYLGLAAVYMDLSTVFGGVPPAGMRPKVMFNARKALELDSNLVEAHVLLGTLLQEEWRWSESEAEFKRAIDLAPNDANAEAGYAHWLGCQGRTDEALALIRRARNLDPVAISGTDVAWILFESHRYEEAIREERGALAVHPDDAMALWTLGFVLIADDRSADAIPFLEKAFSVSNRNAAIAGVLIRAYARAGRRNDALKLLSELNRQRSKGYIPAAAFVNAYLGLGDSEQAFVWLEKAYQEKSNILQFAKTHPFFDPIRSDPRFVDLLRRVGLG